MVTNSLGSTGLATCILKPAEVARCRSSAFPYAVSATAGTFPPLGVEAAHLPNERVTVLTRHFDVGDENVRPPILDDSQSLCRRRTYAHVGTGVDQDGHDEIKALSVVIDGEQSKSHK